MYWQPSTLTVLHAVAEWRRQGIEVCATIDAGPNVHCLCAPGQASVVKAKLQDLPGVDLVFECPPGEAARLLPD